MNKGRNLEEFISNLRKKGIATYYSAFSKDARKFGSKPLFTEFPDPIAVPWYWNYSDCMEALTELTEHLTVEQAERRAIHLINPGLQDTFLGNSGILPTLYGGFQMIKPSDSAPSHRHTPVNFRFIMEAPDHGAYTIINGYKIELHPGDISAQIPWVWHEHINEGKNDLVWFSGLDAPLISYLAAMFYSHPENGEERFLDEISGEDCSELYGQGLRANYDNRNLISEFNSSQNPLTYYPYKKSDAALNKLLKVKKVNEPAYVEYVDPSTGGPIFKSISLGLLRFDHGSEIDSRRVTENAVFTMFKGELTFEVEGYKETIHAKKGDVIAIPTWRKYSISNPGKSEATVLKYSDSPIFKFLGLYREN